MQLKEYTKEELRQEIKRLQAEAAEQEKTLQRLRLREEGYLKLFHHIPKHVFSIPVDHDGLDFEAALLAHAPSQHVLPVLLEQPGAREHCTQAVADGHPVEFEESIATEAGQQTWRLLLVPVKDEAGEVLRLLGSLRNVTRQRKERQTLRETQQRYERLLELLPDGVTIADSSERILYVNDAGLRLLGASSQAQVRGRSIWDFVHPEDYEKTRRHMQQLRAGRRPEVVEQTLQRVDGREVDIEIASVPIRYGGAPAVLITARDLTERRAMQQVLSETQEMFYKAFHLGPAALAVSTIAEGRLVDVNEEFRRLSGYTAEELRLATTDALGLWADLNQRRAVIGELVRDGSVRQRELKLRQKGGSVRTILMSAQRIEVHGEPCMLTCAVDITDRKQAEMAEQESRDLLSRVFHASPAAISIARLSDGRFIDINEAYTQLTGYTRAELLEAPMSAVQLWRDPARRTELVERLQDERVVHDAEAEIVLKDGEHRTVLVSLQQIQVQGEMALLAVLSDITQRKQAEEALRRAKEQAEEMEQIKTTILTNLTHEVRTPLTVILGFSSVLREGVRKEYERFVTLIERSGRRLLLMLDAILDLAQLEAGTLDLENEPFNLVEVIQEAATTLQPLAEYKGLHFGMQLPREEVLVRFDAGVLKRVLGNLLDNAIKFTDKGGITVALEEQEENLYIKVIDTGIGIEKAFVPHLFDEFSQESTGLNRSHQGSGLGLAVSKRLIELAGGCINVTSEKGEGSVFTIELPNALRGRSPSA